jgi:hypothetical protein
MPKTQVSCPNCRQPVVAEIDQLFDLNTDPSAKQRLLSGAANLIQCQACGYQGGMATPIVYHDPEKELLLTFVPPELNLPRDDQERAIGALINQVVDSLPQEKRKGYLLNPQATLTMQGLLERILEGDGITREMLDAQQKRISLIQRLATATDDSVLEEIAKQEDQLIDADFFNLLRSLVETAAMGGDEQSARQLTELQQKLLPITSFGRELQEQSQEVEAAVEDLRALGEEMSREQLLELVINAPNETRLQALVGMARPAMDYSFFQMLSEKIDKARGDGRNRLVELRTELLEMTQEIDRQIEAHVQDVRRLIQMIIGSDDVTEAMTQSLRYVDEYFLKELDALLQAARQSGDLEQSGKLQQMLDVIQKASSGPPELAIIEEYIDSEGEEAREQFLEEHQEEITPEFMSMLANIAVQVGSGDDQEFAERVNAANRQALRFSMKRSLNA